MPNLNAQAAHFDEYEGPAELVGKAVDNAGETMVKAAKDTYTEARNSVMQMAKDLGNFGKRFADKVNAELNDAYNAVSDGLKAGVQLTLDTIENIYQGAVQLKNFIAAGVKAGVILTLSFVAATGMLVINGVKFAVETSVKGTLAVLSVVGGALVYVAKGTGQVLKYTGLALAAGVLVLGKLAYEGIMFNGRLIKTGVQYAVIAGKTVALAAIGGVLHVLEAGADGVLAVTAFGLDIAAEANRTAGEFMVGHADRLTRWSNAMQGTTQTTEQQPFTREEVATTENTETTEKVEGVTEHTFQTADKGLTYIIVGMNPTMTPRQAYNYCLSDEFRNANPAITDINKVTPGTVVKFPNLA